MPDDNVNPSAPVNPSKTLPPGPHPAALDVIRRYAEEVFDTSEGVRVARETLTRAEADAQAALHAFQKAVQSVSLEDLARALVNPEVVDPK